MINMNTMKGRWVLCIRDACYLTKGKAYLCIASRDHGAESVLCVMNDKDEGEWYFTDGFSMPDAVPIGFDRLDREAFLIKENKDLSIKIEELEAEIARLTKEVEELEKDVMYGIGLST